jgi:hypothetical protein
MHAQQDQFKIQQAQYELMVAEPNAKYHDNMQVQTHITKNGPVEVVTPSPIGANLRLAF